MAGAIDSREQLHQAYLGEHVTSFSAWQLDQAGLRMPGSPVLGLMHGLMANQPRGFGMVYESIQRQASLLAYNDMYRTLAMAAAIFIPAFLLLKKGSGKPAAAH